MKALPRLFLPVLSAICVACVQKNVEDSLPPLPPFPEIPDPTPIASISLGSLDVFPEDTLDIPVTPGPFQPNWESIEDNYPGTPGWLRDAKFGIWVHFGPQSYGESGDWYARNLYDETNERAYQNHLKRFGHPSEVGYKEVLRDWNPYKLDPARLTALYKKAGARFLLIQGVHHDNFDMWDSKYQPWNSVNLGPKRDLLKEWTDACRKEGMRYGVTFHHEYTWWWWQTAFGSDSEGDKAGVPYDGNLKPEDGQGKWWEGYDPRMLYGIDLREYKTVGPPNVVPDDGIFTRHLDYARWYATQWALRIMDVTHNYDPDFIYTDGTSQGPFCGTGTGTGYKCNAMPLVMADFYNRVKRDRGDVDVFSVVKFRSPTNGTVTTEEFGFPDGIKSDQPWIRETPVGDWFYAPGITYDAKSVIRVVIEAVCRDGNAAVSIPIKPDGSLEEACERMLEEVGEWMDACGEAVYGSSAWKTMGERTDEARFLPEDIRFTLGKNGCAYAFFMEVPEPGQLVRIKSMGLKAGLMGQVKGVSLLGHEGELQWNRTDEALEIRCPEQLPFKSAIVFRIDNE